MTLELRLASGFPVSQIQPQSTSADPGGPGFQEQIYQSFLGTGEIAASIDTMVIKETVASTETPTFTNGEEEM